MKTIALIEKGSDGTYGIYTPDIDHTIVGDGESVVDAKLDFELSVKEMIASYVDEGKELPEELKDIEFEFKYDVASLFNYFNWIKVSQFAKIAGINASLLRQYKSGIQQYISESQIEKIEKALHKIGNEIAAVKLT